MKGLIFYRKNGEVVTCLRGETLDCVDEHLQKGYPDLLEEFRVGDVQAAIVDIDEMMQPDECIYDGTSLVAMTPEEKEARDARQSLTENAKIRMVRLTEMLNREATLFFADRLRANGNITQEEYEALRGMTNGIDVTRLASSKPSS